MDSAVVPLALDLISHTLTGLDIYERYKNRRLKIMRKIILEEIGNGASPLLVASEDDAIEIVIRLQQATVMGTAKVNLRLMARVLQGLAVTSPIHAPDFARFQRMLSDLTRDEIILLSTLHSEYQITRQGPNRVSAAWESTINRLVPVYFKSNDHMRATAYSAQRSGLLMMENNLDAIGYLTPSPLMDELASLASLDESLWANRL